MAFLNEIDLTDLAVIDIQCGFCAFLEVSKWGVIKTALMILAEVQESSGEWAVRLPQIELTNLFITASKTKQFWQDADQIG